MKKQWPVMLRSTNTLRRGLRRLRCRVCNEVAPDGTRRNQSCEACGDIGSWDLLAGDGEELYPRSRNPNAMPINPNVRKVLAE